MSPNMMATPDLIQHALQHAERERMQAHTQSCDIIKTLCERLTDPSLSVPQAAKSGGLLTAQDPARDPLSLRDRLAKAARADELESENAKLRGEIHLHKTGRQHSDAEWEDLNRRHRDLQTKHDEMRGLCDDKCGEVSKLEERIISADERMGELAELLTDAEDKAKPKAVQEAITAAIAKVEEARTELLPAEPAAEEAGGNPPAGGETSMGGELAEELRTQDEQDHA